MAREEVARVVADIARAIQSSDLLSLLRQEGESNTQKRSLPLLRRRNHPTVKCSSLAEIPKSLLDEKVASIRTVLETIDAPTLLDLEILREREHGSRQGAGPRVRDGIYCRPIIDQIKPALNLNDDDDDVSMGSCEDDDEYTPTNNSSSSSNSVVRYLHIAEVPDEYTIGIFVFGPHERIPLHDHPEMCVLSRVLYGDLQRLSLDLDRKGRNPNPHDGDGSSFEDMETEEDEDDENQEEEENPNEASVSSIRQLLETQSSSAKIDKHSSNNTNNNSNNSNGSSSSSFFSAALSRSATWLQNNLYNTSSSSGIAMDDESGDFQYYHHRRRNSHRQHPQPPQASRRSRRSRDAISTTFPEGTKLAYRNAMDVLEAPQVASLYPYEGNLHEFVAGPHGAAVLDVLLPPYDDDRKRDCTFYHIRELPPSAASGTATGTTPTTAARRKRPSSSSNGRFSRATSTSTAMTTVRNGERNPPPPQPQQPQRVPCLIVPTGQPENFHCISGRYKDLGETDDYYEYQYEDD